MRCTVAVVLSGFVIFASSALGQECYQHVDSLVASNQQGGARFGTEVVVHDDLLFIGAGNEATNLGWVFERSNGEWVEAAELIPTTAITRDYIRAAIVRDDLVIIGLPLDDHIADNAGSVFVFRRDSARGTWSEETVLRAPNAVEGDYFGITAALYGDRLFVGAKWRDETSEDSGIVYCFQNTESDWSLVDTILPPSPQDRSFGDGLAISGDQLIVGASASSDFAMYGGAVHVFEESLGQWTHQQTLAPAGLTRSAFFGRDVVVDGDWLAVGAPNDDSAAFDAGAIYMYKKQGNGSWTEQVTLTIPDADEQDAFTEDIALRNGVLLGGLLRSRDIGALSGAAHVWELDGAEWRYAAKIWSPQVEAYARFGHEVAIDSGGRLLISEYHADAPAPDDAGTVRIFEFAAVSDQSDCNADGVPDACQLQTDCNANGIADLCDIASGMGDCNGDYVLDVCEISAGAEDCDSDGIPDDCAVALNFVNDCNGNGIPDSCDLAKGLLDDCNDNGVSDLCEEHDYAIEDGSFGTFWYVTSHYDHLWMNEFRVQDGSQWINSLSVEVRRPTPIPVTILVYRDPDQDGDPADSELVFQENLGAIATEGWHRVWIPPTYVGAVGDIYYVGMFATTLNTLS